MSERSTYAQALDINKFLGVAFQNGSMNSSDRPERRYRKRIAMLESF
ncbi:MAG: hypothetical protein KME49_14245 [Brasilonema octagenarum HA4186-MV1]|nr:hypothetical protein [Brasilonema octagenarum HA4186-MV1]